MAIVLVHQGPGVRRESYDRAVRSMTGQSRRSPRGLCDLRMAAAS